MTNQKVHDKLRYFPVTSFAIILGLGALTIMFDKWHHLQWIPELPYTIMMVVVTLLFFLFLTLYGIKALIAPEEVLKDFRHRTRVNFFPAISISALILSIIYMGRFPFASIGFWYVGALAHTILTFIIMARWISKDVEIHHYNPAWFIPVVGLILIPVAGTGFLPPKLMLFFYAPAFIMWIILLTIVFYRIIFYPQLPSKLMPTLFMLAAPPAVAFISYVRIHRQIDSFAFSLLIIASMFMLLMIFMHKRFKNLPFFLSWWSFTFPLGAFSIAWTVAYLLTREIAFAYPAWIFGGITILVNAVVIWHTIINIKHGNICVEED
ncbi:SLAC1 anion channel family protein [bacterium]|nr:SLAC1 anion channel family protein [bacterium]